jgi:hypothetical protein
MPQTHEKTAGEVAQLYEELTRANIPLFTGIAHK